MRTSEEIYHQVRWDPRLDPARFVLGLLQRGAAPKRIPLPAFVPGGDIPWHRVLFVEADGELVWDRSAGLDRVGLSEAGRVREPRRLRAPFFTARTPYAWDAAAGRWSPAGAAPTAGADVPAAEVRLLTWNTLWDRYDADRIDTARRRPRLLAALAAADADVIALQEVEPALLDMLLAADWVRARYTLGTDPGGRDVDDSGLLLLSRLPVREAGGHRLGPHKAVAAVVVDTAGGPLVVAASHLSSDHSENGAGRREAELARLGEGLGGVEGDLVVLGDFNDGRDGPEGPAAALGLRDAWTEAHGPADRTPTFDPGANPLAAVSSLTGRASRLDRILLRGGARVAGAGLLGDVPEADGLFLSDHYGVRAELSVGAEGEGTGGVPVLDVPATARTALAWLPPREWWPGVQELRRDHDPQVHRWPPHVNLLFGFVPEAEFERAAPLVAAVAAGTAPFPVRPAGVHTFGHREDATVWLDPAAAGEAPWQELRAALAARFPGCRGRSGAGYTPHLTLGRSADPQRVAADCAERLARAGLPAARAGELVLLSRRGEEPMRARATVALGTGEVRWLPEPAPAAAAGAPGGPADGAPGGAPGEPDADSVAARVAAALGEGVVEVVGSRRTGCALPGADLDLVAALPGRADAEGVADRIRAALPEATRLRQVIGARVPGLRFAVGGLAVDLVLVGAGNVHPGQAVARRAELDPAAAVALSSVSDAEAVREAVGAAGREAEFAQLARQVKAWARARGLDSAPHGGLPGLAWSVLAARTVLQTPPSRPAAPQAAAEPGAEPGAARADEGRTPAGPAEDRARTGGAGEPGGDGGRALLQEFFGAWAAWDWRRPVTLASAAEPTAAAGPEPTAAAGAEPAGGGGAVTVLTPSAPVRSCTAQVGPGFRDLLVQELYQAWETLEAGGSPAGLLSPPPLHRRHAAWAIVTVRADTEAEFEAAAGRMRGRMRALLTALEEAGVPDVHAWPRPFRSSPTRARFAVGLGPAPPSRSVLAAVADAWSRDLPGVETSWAEGGALGSPA
ncbi:RNA repair domain-containing protein [Streptomyces sp. NPDC051211]|uniref:RNA repair domain-containing protein n=1 Tax=Streptomyces sp. NPDC051211 TaxID=3154643 RepID=UPI003450B8AE